VNRNDLVARVSLAHDDGIAVGVDGEATVHEVSWVLSCYPRPDLIQLGDPAIHVRKSRVAREPECFAVAWGRASGKALLLSLVYDWNTVLQHHEGNRILCQGQVAGERGKAFDVVVFQEGTVQARVQGCVFQRA